MERNYFCEFVLVNAETGNAITTLNNHRFDPWPICRWQQIEIVLLTLALSLTFWWSIADSILSQSIANRCAAADFSHFPVIERLEIISTPNDHIIRLEILTPHMQECLWIHFSLLSMCIKHLMCDLSSVPSKKKVREREKMNGKQLRLYHASLNLKDSWHIDCNGKKR